MEMLSMLRIFDHQVTKAINKVLKNNNYTVNMDEKKYCKFTHIMWTDCTLYEKLQCTVYNVNL